MDKRMLLIYGSIAVAIILIAWGVKIYFDKDKVDELTDNPKINDKDNPFGGVSGMIGAAVYGPKYYRTQQAQKYMDSSDLFNPQAMTKAGIERDKDELFNESVDYLINEFNATNIDEEGIFRSLEENARGEWGAFNLLYINDLLFRKTGRTLPDYFNDSSYGIPDFDVHDGARFYDIIETAIESPSFEMLRERGLNI